MTDDFLVSCREVTKTYSNGTNTTYALRGINLDIRAGELFMLVGPSGCGKTSLISIIAGILNNDSGSCLVTGKNLKEMSDKQKTLFRGHNLGFVFQSFNLIPTLTAAENVSIPLLLQGVNSRLALSRAKEVLAKVKLDNKAESRPSELSGGQQQRIAIARALVHNPTLIVCDEPTSALDKDTGHTVMELFREVALSEGRTLIIVTHDSRIFSFADRIAKMNDGVIESVVSGAHYNELA